MQSFTIWPETTSDEDQDEQCWKDVEAETGFESYRSFVRSLVDSGRNFRSLMGALDYSQVYSTALGEVVVLDIQKDGSYATSLTVQGTTAATLTAQSSIRDWQSANEHASRKISTRILQNLRSPLGNVAARIVLWSITGNSYPHMGLIEALGLGLDIHPSFFAALQWLQSERGGPKPIGFDNIIIGDSVFTVARKYRRDGRAPPVLIIAGRFDLDYSMWSNIYELHEPFFMMVQNLMEQEIGTRASLYRPAIDKRPPDDLASVPSNYYLKLLSKYVYKDVYKDCNVDSKDDVMLLTAVLPLLHLEILRLRIQCTDIESNFLSVQFGVEQPTVFTDSEKQDNYNLLDKQRFWLRRRLEDLHESRASYVKFALSQGAAGWLKSKTWLSQDGNIKEALANVRIKEAEVRDYMQLQIGNLSILESRKSIQLSNRQMEEARRGKKNARSPLIIFANKVQSKYVGSH